MPTLLGAMFFIFVLPTVHSKTTKNTCISKYDHNIVSLTFYLGYFLKIHVCRCCTLVNSAWYVAASLFYFLGSCRRASTTILHAEYYYKGGNKKRDKHLQVVKLLTALSYRVGSSFVFSCSRVRVRIAFTAKR